jgi:hypothetical protein
LRLSLGQWVQRIKLCTFNCLRVRLVCLEKLA